MNACCTICNHEWRCEEYNVETMACPNCGDKPKAKPTYTQAMEEAGTLPSVGMECLYKERGGINWRKCIIIAIHGVKIWLENLETNSCPLNNISTLEFKPLTPPIELIDGEPYMFRLNGQLIGFYLKDRKSFFTKLFNGNKICGEGEPTNITLLTPEGK